MKLFRRSPRPTDEPARVDVHLNARVLPADRRRYEDRIEKILDTSFPGSQVTDSGTEFVVDEGPTSCDLGIALDPLSAGDGGHAVLASIVGEMEEAGAPRGSFAELVDGTRVHFGRNVGLGLYLDGTFLPAGEDASNIVADLAGTVDDALGDEGDVQSLWETSMGMTLSIYGPSDTRMRQLVVPVLESAPLAGAYRLISLR